MRLLFIAKIYDTEENEKPFLYIIEIIKKTLIFDNAISWLHLHANGIVILWIEKLWLSEEQHYSLPLSLLLGCWIWATNIQ